MKSFTNLNKKTLTVTVASLLSLTIGCTGQKQGTPANQGAANSSGVSSLVSSEGKHATSARASKGTQVSKKQSQAARSKFSMKAQGKKGLGNYFGVQDIFVVNRASFDYDKGVSPLSLAAAVQADEVYGEPLADWESSDSSFPTSLGGVTVNVSPYSWCSDCGEWAGISYVSPTEVNFDMPDVPSDSTYYINIFKYGNLVASSSVFIEFLNPGVFVNMTATDSNGTTFHIPDAEQTWWHGSQSPDYITDPANNTFYDIIVGPNAGDSNTLIIPMTGAINCLRLESDTQQCADVQVSVDGITLSSSDILYASPTSIEVAIDNDSAGGEFYYVRRGGLVDIRVFVDGVEANTNMYMGAIFADADYSYSFSTAAQHSATK